MAWFAKLLLLASVLLLCYAVLRRILRKYLEWQEVQTLVIPERVGLKLEFIKTVAQILGGAFFILTIIVAYLNYKVSQEKHTTDLFTKAIEQLGDKKMTVRLGGIYALERIARDSEKDHWPIMEVFTAYVRENAKYEQQEQKGARKEQAIAVEPLKPKTDVQAILTVLGRRHRTYGKGEDQRLNLERTNLFVANLRESHLEGADLSWAHLEFADLYKAQVQGANLWGAQLNDAELKEANLSRANLSGASLERADLSKSYLEGANLSGAHLMDANFFNTHLERAMLVVADFWKTKNLQKDQIIQARGWQLAFFDAGLLKELGLPPNHNERLQKQDLSYYNLEDVDLRGAFLQGFKLKQANLKGANLERANLAFADMEGGDFSNAHLEEADLTWANLSKATGLTQEQIDSAYCDDETKLPPGLKCSRKKELRP